MKVGVIAGTPVDTNMGMDYLRSVNPELELYYMALWDKPVQCHLFQLRPMEEKHAHYVELFEKFMAQGVKDYFVYCNSVSGTFDFDSFAREMGVRIYTPLQVYEELGTQYEKVSVIAANNQSTAGIEKSLYEKNPAISVVGVGYLDMVNAVEAEMPPKELIREFALDALMKYFEANRCQCIILGCTHFPWFKKELAEITSMEVVDPADVMYRNLMEGYEA